MSKKLFVGNIDWDTEDKELSDLFSKFGSVEEAVIIKDKMSGRSKGFGFVTFTKDEDAKKAMDELDGKELNGRQISVKEARPPKERTPGDNSY